jgi:hypothetical protein
VGASAIVINEDDEDGEATKTVESEDMSPLLQKRFLLGAGS